MKRVSVVFTYFFYTITFNTWIYKKRKAGTYGSSVAERGDTFTVAMYMRCIGGEYKESISIRTDIIHDDDPKKVTEHFSYFTSDISVETEKDNSCKYIVDTGCTLPYFNHLTKDYTYSNCELDENFEPIPHKKSRKFSRFRIQVYFYLKI